MAETLVIEAWVMWRPGADQQPEMLGIFESRQSAERNLLHKDWRVAGPVLLFDWGFIAETGRKLANVPISCPSYGVH